MQKKTRGILYLCYAETERYEFRNVMNSGTFSFCSVCVSFQLVSVAYKRNGNFFLSATVVTHTHLTFVFKWAVHFSTLTVKHFNRRTKLF